MRIKSVQTLIDKLRGKQKNIDINDIYKAASSYSQSGEDLIICYILENIFQKTKINYLDIGAHHSTWLSNTRLFYDKGNRGVLIEPDPSLYKEIKEHRKGDICLNCGISFESSNSADFYIMEAATLNTFDRETAYHNQKYNNQKIKEVIKIPLMKVNDIFQKYFPGGCDFLSLDVEGLEMQILSSMDLKINRPLVFCVETAEYAAFANAIKKETDIIEFLKDNNYFQYADTFINTIFIDKKYWDAL